MSKHTPEPWVFSCGAIFQERGTASIATTHGAELFKGAMTDQAMINERIKVDALRIVECVNACAGMDNPAQEIQSLKAGNEKLSAAIEYTASRNAALALLLREFRPCVEWAITSGVCGEIALARIDAALAGWLPDHIADASKMVPDGWQLVPVQPTPLMLDAAEQVVAATGGFPEIWQYMLESAPKPHGTNDVNG